MTMSPMRGSREPARQVSQPDARRPRPASVRRRARYEDDDDFDVDRSPPSDENATSAGMIGFIAALVSLGLLAVVVVLYIFLKLEDEKDANIDRSRLLYYWFLILDVLSFFAALTATILGARGSSRTNTIYRGYGVAALVMGIFEMVITVCFGFWMTCAVMWVELMRAGAG